MLSRTVKYHDSSYCIECLCESVVLCVQVVYTMELRPAGLLGGGFILPDEEIRPTGEENLAATLTYGEMLLQGYAGRSNV